jgi:hypothetical protein
MYIRASVHGIRLSNSEVGAVAIGDTFLFSPLATNNYRRSISEVAQTTSLHSIDAFLGENSCITHVIPCYQSYIGTGAEDNYARLVNYCSKHTAT